MIQKRNAYGRVLRTLGLICLLGIQGCKSYSTINAFEYGQTPPPEAPQAKVVFFNASNPKLYSTTGIIEVRVENENLGKLKLGEYLETDLAVGTRKLMLEHKDMWYFTTRHTIRLAEATHYYKVIATLFGHRVQEVAGVPEGFVLRLEE